MTKAAPKALTLWPDYAAEQAKAKRQALGATMAFQLRLLPALRGFVQEHTFHPDRKWRFDFAWPAERCALEVEGGTWIAGRHSRGKGLERDCEKYAAAAILGWTVIRATTDQVTKGIALEWMERILGSRSRSSTPVEAGPVPRGAADAPADAPADADPGPRPGGRPPGSRSRNGAGRRAPAANSD